MIGGHIAFAITRRGGRRGGRKNIETCIIIWLDFYIQNSLVLRGDKSVSCRKQDPRLAEKVLRTLIFRRGKIMPQATRGGGEGKRGNAPWGGGTGRHWTVKVAHRFVFNLVFDDDQWRH